MTWKRFHDERLAQASYLVGCPATGDALAIDPNWDVDQYLRATASEGLRVVSANGRVVVAEFHPNGACQVGPPREHCLAPRVVTDWYRAEGFQSLGERRQTPEHDLLVLARA